MNRLEALGLARLKICSGSRNGARNAPGVLSVTEIVRRLIQYQLA
jgi:hypothetical protein